MGLKMWQLVVLVFTLGCCLLQCGSASPMNITCSIYDGDVGHAASYNYPLRHSYDDTDTYTYRLFPDRTSKEELCLTVHQFDIGTESRFTIFAPTVNGTTQNFEYTGHGERVNLPDDTTLPLNIWTEFCVDLNGYDSLVITFSPDNTNPVPGFHIEYSARDAQAAVEQETLVRVSSAPCGSGLFTCYNRECVNDRYICKNEAACTDMSHNTFAHAFCKDSDGAPVQQAGFWATDFDAGLHGVDVDSGWVLASKVELPLVGPSTDHTHYGPAGGKFVHTVFPPTNRTAKMTLEQIALVAKENCLSFWYYMDGVDPGQLTVEWGLTKVWQRSGSYSAMWLQAQVNLFCESPPCSDKVTFTAEKATNPDTRISVDDVSLLPGVCPFNDGDLTQQGWPTQFHCYILKYGQMACNNSYNHASSSFINRGKCLAGTIIFPDYGTVAPTHTLTISQYPMNQSGIQLRDIKQRFRDEELLVKIPVDFSIPSKIVFNTLTMAGADSIIRFEYFHILDSDCENLSVGCYDRFMCSEGECIEERYLCNGYKSCENGRDEENCTECKRDAFLCNNHRCIGRKLVCNGADDCGDKSEEQNCPAAAGSNTGSVVTMAIAVLVAAYGNPFSWG